MSRRAERSGAAPLAVTSAAITFLSFAMPAAMLGVMWPEVRAEFHQPLGALGLVSLVYGVARMSAATSGRVLARRFGSGGSFVVALGCLVAAVAALAGSPSWPAFLAGVAGLGVVSGVLDSLGAGFITAVARTTTAGLVHGSYGVGATAGPLVVALVGGWRWALFGSMVVAAGALWIAWAARSSWPGPPDAAHGGDAAPTAALDVATALLSLALFAALVAVEVTAGQWSFTYLTDHRSVSSGLAAVGVSGFWGGTMVGRLLLARPGVASTVGRVGSTGLGAVAGALLVGVGLLPAPLAVAALALAGLALAPLVPTLFAGTARRVGTSHAAKVAGWQLLATNFGAIAVPSLTGALVSARGPGMVVWVLVVAVLAVAVPLLVAVDRRPAVKTGLSAPSGATAR